MKYFRFATMLILVLAVVAPLPANAQLKGLRNRLTRKAQDKVERAVEQRVERAMDRALDRMINSVADDIESSIEGMIFGDAPPPVELSDNESGPADAPYVRYTEVSRIQLGGMGMPSSLMRRFGATQRVVSTHQHSQRTDEASASSQIIDADARSMTQLDHEKKQWWSMTFEEMMQGISDMAASMQNQAGTTGKDSDTSIEIKESTIDVRQTGERMDINGSSATQTIIALEGSYEMKARDEETGEEVEARGKSYVVYDVWQSTEVAGYETIVAFQRSVAESMADALAGSGLQTMIESMHSVPQIQASAGEAFEKIDVQNGLPLRTTVYFVQVDEGAEFDLEAVLASEAEMMTPAEGPAQRVTMSMLTEIGSLSTAPFEEGYLGTPADYEEIASPLKSIER